jgi:hypothetical protein
MECVSVFLFFLPFLLLPYFHLLLPFSDTSISEWLLWIWQISGNDSVVAEATIGFGARQISCQKWNNT